MIPLKTGVFAARSMSPDTHRSDHSGGDSIRGPRIVKDFLRFYTFSVALELSTQRLRNADNFYRGELF
jgi:hypothetical protein